MNDFDPYTSTRRNMNAGFRVGMIGAVIMIVVHLFLLLINQGETNGDLLAWLLQLVVYFFAAQSAAQQQYDAQERSYEPLRGVQAAGVGAALTISFLVWVYIILRGVFRDAFGITIDMNPVWLYCMVVLDVLLALGLGSWGGHLVVKKYENFT